MKYSDYKKGSSALRHIINDENVEYARQFASFRFTLNGRRNASARILRGIWNAKTKNIIAFINQQNVVFVRPGSVYSGQLLGSGTHKVIKNNKLNLQRDRVGRTTRRYSEFNLMAEKAVDRIIKTDDKPNKVFLFKAQEGEEIDTRFIRNRIKDLLKVYKLNNTIYSLDNNDFEYDHTADGMIKAYLNVQDYAEAIKQKERIERIKHEIAEAWLDNVRTIAEDALVSRRSMNPLQFVYNDGGEEVTGILRLDEFDLRMPNHIPIREWINVDAVISTIRFHERYYSLAERGIDETPVVQPRVSLTFSDMARRVQSQMLRDMPQPPVNYMYADESAYGENVVMPDYRDVFIDRRAESNMTVAPELTGNFTVDEARLASQMMVDEYPTEAEVESVRENNYDSTEQESMNTWHTDDGQTYRADVAGSDFDPSTSG